MVNVDVSPSVILGVGLIGAGVSLWQIRRVKPWISKDYDVVVSCVSLLVGGILIFQGWRLDPLLLFGQLMTTGAALSFAIEALRLRSEVYEGEERAALQDVFRRKGGPGGGDGTAAGGAGGSFQLPPPDAQQQQQQPWEASTSSSTSSGGQQGVWAASREWQAAPPADPAGFYDYSQQQQQPTASSSSSDGAYGYSDQQYQGGYYGDAQQYQAAEFNVPPGVDASLQSGYAGGSSSNEYLQGSPSGLAFPTDYGVGDGSLQGDPQQQWQQQQPPPGGSSSPPVGSVYDDLDDW